MEQNIEYFRARRKQLDIEFEKWRAHWKDISQYMLPRRGRYLSGGRETENDGAKKHQYIINGSPQDAIRVYAGGMQGGLTSPSRPWFELALPDEDLMNFGPVKDWLYKVRAMMLHILARSNFYGSTHSVYTEIAPFGTGCMLIEEDFKSVIRCRPFTIGEYRLGLDSKYRPDTLYRSFSMTAKQMIEEFGEENVSDHVKNAMENKGQDTWFEVDHCIEPNLNVVEGAEDYRGMAFLSIYFETGINEEKYLRKGGYKTIPFVAPRWNVVGTDVYGEGPGMAALGDVKMLQKMEEKALKALDKMVDPPMVAPVSMKGKGGSVIPGGITYVDDVAGSKAFGPAYLVKPDFQDMEFKITQVTNRIRSYFFNDMFMAILATDKRMTAREVAERHDEKMLLIGPVIERLQSEMLDPIIERVFSIIENFGMLPPIPDELQGKELKVRYISLLAKAQQLIETSAIEQTAGFVANLAQFNPSALDKFNFDAAVDQFSNTLGTPPEIIRTDDEVAALREARAQQQAQQAAMQNAAAMVQGAKTMSETPIDKNSLLNIYGDAIKNRAQ